MSESPPVVQVDQGTDWLTASISMATLAVVIITVVVAYFALKDARRTRHGQLIADLTRDWIDEKVLAAHALHGKYSEADFVALADKLWNPNSPPPTDSDRELWSQISLLANLIESLGVLVSEKAITTKVVYEMWGGPILVTWPKWDEAIKKIRDFDSEPETFSHFEELYLEIKKINTVRKHPASTGWSIDPPSWTSEVAQRRN